MVKQSKTQYNKVKTSTTSKRLFDFLERSLEFYRVGTGFLGRR